MEINYDRTFGEEFGLNPAEYADIAIKELHFSVRVSNRLQRDNIHTVADLLNTTGEHLMVLSGFGKNCFDEVIRTLSNLPSIISQQLSCKNLPTGSISPLIALHKEAIVHGDFSPFESVSLSDTDQNVLGIYKEAFDVLGEELVFDCYTAPDKILPVTVMLQEFCRTVKLQNELRDIISKLPAHRQTAYAIGYINAFTLKDEVRATLKTLLKSEDATIASLASVDETIYRGVILILAQKSKTYSQRYTQARNSNWLYKCVQREKHWIKSDPSSRSPVNVCVSLRLKQSVCLAGIRVVFALSQRFLPNGMVTPLSHLPKSKLTVNPTSMSCYSCFVVLRV